MQNVAAEVANKLCESVALKLEGSVMGTFQSLTRTVKVIHRFITFFFAEPHPRYFALLLPTSETVSRLATTVTPQNTLPPLSN
jgi:hypothetical protein